MLNIVKNTTFISPLDLLAPHSCRGCGAIGTILCDCCKNNIISHPLNLCPKCKHKTPTGNCPNCKDLPPAFVVGKRSELIGTLIHDFKYHSVYALASPLASILDQTIPHFDGPVSIIPLPTIGKHIRARGFDHTHLIAKKLAKLRSANYHVSNLLLRDKNTVQVGANRTARLSQASSAYILNPNIKIAPHTTYLLLDDVWTTGASMQAAIQKLQSAKATKIAIAILALSQID